jgi:subtilase family serine protease
VYRYSFSTGLLLSVLFDSTGFSQRAGTIPPPRELITQAVNNSQYVALRGNTRAGANANNDRGIVADSLPLEHMLLQLKRPAELAQALDQFTKDLDDRTSPNYHRWLTAAQFGEKFGLTQSDVDGVTGWLESQGFRVNQVYSNKVTIDFSGTAGQIRQAFRTEIHNLDVNGEIHIANMSDPQVPAALAPAVAGIASLHDFMPRPKNKPRANYTFTVSGSTYQAVVPADLATIYNLNPLFSMGISGQGQTIAVIENTNVYSATDWTTFRSTFGLSSYTSGSFTQVHPGSCSNPGAVAENEGEAILDAEWASAAAPSAAIELASCSDTATTFGGLIALQNLLNASGTPPALVSISYGECEVENGAAANATYSSAFQQAVAEGVSVFVSAGDEGAAGCDGNAHDAAHGIGVSGFASTPYNVAVGGTDFGDSYAGTNSTYWNTTNTTTYGSAKSYIPEIPWNDSCASGLIASYLGYPQSWGSGGFCNSATGKADFINVVAGSGGPSGCATGSPNVNGVVGGTCAGYAKPAWQTGIFGNPNDGVRDIPDVSLFAANGVWGHYYIFCWSDTANGGASCSGAPSSWAGAGGTSFSSPIMAGIQALVNQSTGSRWGNPNPHYYALAAAEYGSAGTSTCQSNSPSSSCTFYDVTQGDMDVVCGGTTECYGSSGSGRSIIYGVLSTSSSSFVPAYSTGSGWDFATGLGTVNAYNLVSTWTSGTGSPVASLTPNPVSFGNQTVGTTSGAQFITLTNTGTASLAISAQASLGGTNPSDFTITANGCGSTLAAGASCSIHVRFTPTLVGAENATLSVTDNSGGVTGSTQSVSLAGTGVGPVASLTPNPVSFGNEKVGTTSGAQFITLTNTGTATLAISVQANLGGTNGNDFSISANGCGSTLAAGAGCSIHVRFTPSLVGAENATLSVTDNSGGVTGSTQSVSLAGTGVGPVASLTPNPVSFGGQTVGTTSGAQFITLTNTGTAPLTISAQANLSGPNGNDFKITANGCGSTLAAGAACSIHVRFTPSIVGAENATLSVTDNSGGIAGSTQSVGLVGAGLGT